MTSQRDYLPRVPDQQLESLLGALGAVVIEGPRACGKTRTADRVAASSVRLDLDANARQAAATDPSLVLEGAAPRLIDEWQVVPSIWNAIRHAVDQRGTQGQFILTGSAVPADDDTRHTGAGRFARMRMRPLSSFESGLSTGRISLGDLLDGGVAASDDPGLTVADLAEEIVHGGWPASRRLGADQAQMVLRGYLDEVCKADIKKVDGVNRDPEKVARLIRSLARHTATTTALTVLAADAAGPEGKLKDDTAGEYLAALRRLFVVEDQPAWAPHLRSKYQLRRAAKRHFVDPSLAVAALRTTPRRLLDDLNYLGYLFESLVIRDLRIYGQACDAEVLHYRDNNGHEADAVVQAADGRWAAFEVKLGAGIVDDGAESLRRFARQIDTARSGEPAVLGVITGTGYGYVRPDGVQVIPIGALGP
ncbi:MAG: ATP-binding protein [Acidobacteria bacterium]|nr:MAG: ATP-binding protein [Acidobacteriota bacterium]